MRSFVTSVAGLALLVFASTLASTKPGCAGTLINVCGKFSYWVPDDWRKYATTTSERSAMENPDQTLYVMAGPLSDKDSDLSDEDVQDFADEELDDMKVTSDKRDTLEKFNIRLIEGTGVDEGDAVVYKLLALDPGSTEGVLAIIVYGSARAMAKPENQELVERILRSLRPHS